VKDPQKGYAKAMPLTLNALAELSGLASEHVLREEEEETGLSREVILSKMRERLAVMRDSIQRGLASDAPSVAGMVGKNAKTLWEAPDPLRDPLLKRVQAYAMAVNEENARMGRIVAAPTAGSAGTLPGALLGVADHLAIPEERLLMPMVLAAGVAKMINRVIPFYANAFVLGHQWNRVCRLRVSGAFSRTRHRSATTSIISSRSPKYRLATTSFTRGHTRSTGWSSGE
jgi:L-serine deaminase